MHEYAQPSLCMMKALKRSLWPGPVPAFSGQCLQFARASFSFILCLVMASVLVQGLSFFAQGSLFLVVVSFTVFICFCSYFI